MVVLLSFTRGSTSYENGASLSRQAFACHGIVSIMLKKPTLVSPWPPLRKGGKIEADRPISFPPYEGGARGGSSGEGLERVPDNC